MRISSIVIAIVLFGAVAYADRRPSPPRRPGLQIAPLEARVVDLELSGNERIVTVLAGSEQGIGKTWRGAFVDRATNKPLAGGEVTIIRIDRRVTIVKTKLTAEQIRANKAIAFLPR